MSKAVTSTVRRMVYENLGITGSSYGNLKTNQRYPSGYIDDAIASADSLVMRTLLKSRQYHFTEEFFNEVLLLDDDKIDLPDNAELLAVYHYKSAGAEIVRASEITWDMYEMFTLDKPLATNSLFPFDGDDNTVDFGGYFTVKDFKLYNIFFPDGIDADGDAGELRYIKVVHQTTLGSELQSPEGFETAIACYASAVLLMKRADQPEQANFYMNQFGMMMQTYMSPSTNQERSIDK
jgi:hypothetical protein